MPSLLEQPDRQQESAPPAQTAVDPETRDLSTLLLLAIAAGLLAAVAWPLLKIWEVAYTQADSYYAYGPLVPVLAGLMLWHRRTALQGVPKAPFFGALSLLLPALALLIFAEKKEFAAVASVGLLTAIWSSFWLIFGTRWVQAAAFPLAFILWMAPLPGPLLHEATYSSQQLSTVLANQMLHLLTFQTTLSGNIISMDSFTLFVDVPCSGMKLLLTMLMFGAAFAWLTDGPARRRLGLFLFAFPLSVVVNVIRITILGVVGECFGAHAEHAIHDASGLMTVGLGLVILFYTARRIGCRTFAGWPLF